MMEERYVYASLSDGCLGLTGTKTDMRRDKATLADLAKKGLVPIKRRHGNRLATHIGAVTYLECSAMRRRGLNKVTL